jgi:serine/threonine-protein kinase
MGIVYEAHHLDLGRTVALKVLTRETASLGRRFRTEARAIARLDHENLVKLHDFGVTEDGRAYYAMELLDGETLEWQLDRERGMDWREAVRIGVEACRALEAAHAAGVVHRDIKPANLFMTRAGTVKLLDFGIARVDLEEAEVGASPSALALVGTPEYLAPEQASGGTVDERSDLYALGVVLYELATGRLPHAADSTVALLDAKLRLPPEPPRQRAPQRGLPKALERAVLRALERAPERRFQTASELRGALENALLEPARLRRRRRRIGYAVATLLVMASAAGAANVARQPELRERAQSALAPVLDRVQSVRARLAAQRAAALAAEAAPPAKAAPSRPPQLSAPAVAKKTMTAPVAPATEGVKPSEPAGPDAIEAKLAQARALSEHGQSLRAFHELRELGAAHPDDARVLRAWSEAALAVRSWGEAHRVARRWAEIDDSVEAQLHVARMERAVGDTESALAVLRRVLERYPSSNEARELVRMYSGEGRLASH